MSHLVAIALVALPALVLILVAYQIDRLLKPKEEVGETSEAADRWLRHAARVD